MISVLICTAVFVVGYLLGHFEGFKHGRHYGCDEHIVKYDLTDKGDKKS